MTRLSRILMVWLCAACAPLAAQTVYESKSGGSKVYSDRPLPGGKAVELKPLNVIEPVPVEAAAAKPQPAERKDPLEKALPRYKTFAVVFPEANGSVAANNATFEVRVSVDPPLQVGEGHAFRLRMDGREVPGRYTATEMMVPPEFFGDVMPAGAQQHVIEASVVDLQGNVLITAAPVNFQTRFVNVLQRPHGMRPMPKPLPAQAPPQSLEGKRVERPAKEPEREPVRPVK
ncbi:MAG: DUF4124 domain-containing protein [Rhodocyclaceae bacterium]|jgi:hypothetical protein|nr:DUF4124 domain-containing protein [Rhodocyclaceae bacterium]